ncbi:MAG TPA: hypothetical protein PLD55_02350 [bacterium]|jgi:hypothetical protein|nr:hypothetical protein [bacterium]MDX9805488.1 hypothetical protein [bacterium]HNZ53329.1 hypothetical protein [bacterium]HOB71002.1 hypothetical protein [bacterium]HOG44150.1 hypothetical protein [bacterium]
MTFNWQDFLNISDFLFKKANDSGFPDAALRSATSRAYYAAYQVSLEYALTSLNYEKPEKNVHKALIEFYRSRNSTNEKKIADDLYRLKQRRVTADYVFSDSYHGFLADQSIQSSRKIIKQINQMKKI